MPIQTVTTEIYKYGLVTAVEDQTIERGAASSVLNWIEKGDHIELRRGQRFLGSSSVNTGVGKITGLRRVTDSLGVEILFTTYGQKLKYFNETTGEWVESGNNLLGSSVVDSDGIGSENIFMSEYVSPAGNQLWLNSPNCAGVFKIMVSNPDDAVDQYDSSKNFKGLIKIDTNRCLLWRRKEDKTGVYGSYIDTQTYTTVSGEAITGPSGTLAFKSGGSKRTCFGVTIVIGGVTYTDNFAGTLTGSDGSSTGTINYATGAFTVAQSGSGTATYQWENSTNNGIADFTKSTTRLAGQGFVFRQDEGGGSVQNIGTYATVYFCLHLKKTWALTIGSDDTDATNLPYRDKVGIPNPLAMVETGDGIFYIDDQNPDDVKFRVITYATGGSDQILPFSRSESLNLTGYLFDKCAAIEWGDLILFACRTKNSTENNRVFVYTRKWKSWTILDYNVSVFEIYNGALYAGDSLSNNVLELFSGFDDLDAESMDNHWIGKFDDLDTEGLKKTKKFYVEGLIARDQAIDIFLSFDSGQFIKVGTIDGQGSYVDFGQPISIGANVIGKKILGGGSGGAFAYHYERLISLRGLSDKFERVKIKYVATKIGFVSVSTQKYWDVRATNVKVPTKYRG